MIKEERSSYNHLCIIVRYISLSVNPNKGGGGNQKQEIALILCA